MDTYPVRPVTASAFVSADADEVFAYIADTRNDPEWCSNVDSVELVDGPEIGPGTRFEFHQHIDAPRSRRVEFDVEVEVVEMGDGVIRWKTLDKFQHRDITMTVEPENDGCRVTQLTEAAFRRRPGMVAGYGYPILARRTLKRQLKALAAVFAARR